MLDLLLRLSLWFFEVAARLLKTVPRQVARGVALSRWLPIFEGQGIVNPQEIEDKTSHQKIQVSSMMFKSCAAFWLQRLHESRSNLS